MCRGSSIGSTDSQHSRMGSEGAPTWRRGIVGTGDVNTRQRTMGSANGDGKAGNSRGLPVESAARPKGWVTAKVEMLVMLPVRMCEYNSRAGR